MIKTKSFEDLFEYMKIIYFRYTLWNISDILRYVGRPPRIHKQQYPTPYLKLPLLKYEMLTMYAVAPDLFEEDSKFDMIFNKMYRKK